MISKSFKGRIKQDILLSKELFDLLFSFSFQAEIQVPIKTPPI